MFRQRSYGRKKRTVRDKRAALTQLLNFCRPEQLPTFTPEGLAATHGVPANDCARLLEEARSRRLPA
jgi:hypothetical protein